MSTFLNPEFSLEVRANLIPREPLYLRKLALFSSISVTKETLFNVYAACHGRELANRIMKEEKIPSMFLEAFEFGAGQFLFAIELIVLGFTCALILPQYLPGIRLLIVNIFALFSSAFIKSEFPLSTAILHPLNVDYFWTSFSGIRMQSRGLTYIFVFKFLLSSSHTFIQNFFDIHESPKPKWSSDAQELQTWVKQSYLICKTTYLAIVIGVHVALWSLIFYIAYRCIVFGIRRHLCEICKAPDPKLDPVLSIVSFGCEDPQISIADRTKNLIQKFLRKPVIWWLLEPPQRLLLPDTARITREFVRYTCCLVTVGLC